MVLYQSFMLVFWLKVRIRFGARMVVQVIFLVETFLLLIPFLLQLDLLGEFVRNTTDLGVLSVLGVVGPLLVLLSVTVPVFLFANGAVQSLCTFFLCWPIILNDCRCFSREKWPICLASNRFMEAGMVLCHGVSSLTWQVVTVGVALGCCLC